MNIDDFITVFFSILPISCETGQREEDERREGGSGKEGRED